MVKSLLRTLLGVTDGTARELLFGDGERNNAEVVKLMGLAFAMLTQDELEGIDQSTIGQEMPAPATSLSVRHNSRRVLANSGDVFGIERWAVLLSAGDLLECIVACEELFKTDSDTLGDEWIVERPALTSLVLTLLPVRIASL